ncbi:hypothetical protein [Metapseudomonas otitidis]|uniref:hypothetical protein n=1 Tax=Metapseudomonas otitidis TaxID=319939 RepID=UPI0013F5F8AB|nr:hypothetical protein [Pseudomonas otitidis]
MEKKETNPDLRKRLSLKIPATVDKVIEKIIEHRLHQGDNQPTNKTAVAIEMMMIGAQVLNKTVENTDSVKKAYSKEFEVVVKLLLSCEHFSRMTATNTSGKNFNTDTEELMNMRQHFRKMADRLLYSD